MNTHSRVWITAVALALALCAAPVQARPAQLGAILAVRDYVLDLQGGNVDSLRSRLKSDDRRNLFRDRLFLNPGYAQKLRSAYANSSFRIIGTEQVAEDTSHVDVRMLLDGGHPLHVRFVVVGNPEDGFQIVDEI